MWGTWLSSRLLDSAPCLAPAEIQGVNQKGAPSVSQQNTQKSDEVLRRMPLVLQGAAALAKGPPRGSRLPLWNCPLCFGHADVTPPWSSYLSLSGGKF